MKKIIAMLICSCVFLAGMNITAAKKAGPAKKATEKKISEKSGVVVKECGCIYKKRRGKKKEKLVKKCDGCKKASVKKTPAKEIEKGCTCAKCAEKAPAKKCKKGCTCPKCSKAPAKCKKGCKCAKCVKNTPKKAPKITPKKTPKKEPKKVPKKEPKKVSKTEPKKVPKKAPKKEEEVEVIVLPDIEQPNKIPRFIEKETPKEKAKEKEEKKEEKSSWWKFW